jgi:hypothetical protein
MSIERSAAQGQEREVLAKLVETLDDARGTLNYYIGPGARVLHSTTTYDAIYGAVQEAKELLADAD